MVNEQTAVILAPFLVTFVLFGIPVICVLIYSIIKIHMEKKTIEISNKKYNELQEIPNDIAAFIYSNPLASYFIRFLKVHDVYRYYIKIFLKDHRSKKNLLYLLEWNSDKVCDFITPYSGVWNEGYNEIWKKIWLPYYRDYKTTLNYKKIKFYFVDEKTFEKENKLAKQTAYECMFRRKKSFVQARKPFVY